MPGLARRAAEARTCWERHAHAQPTPQHHHTTHDIAIMGALLSLPFLAMPAMGTVCRMNARDCAILMATDMERCRLLLRCCDMQRRYGLLRREVREQVCGISGNEVHTLTT